MKLATRRDGSRDGELLVVSTDLSRAVSARSIARNLLASRACERWLKR
jgi:fumarylacetoacetate (FAA) hydrolase